MVAVGEPQAGAAVAVGATAVDSAVAIEATSRVSGGIRIRLRYRPNIPFAGPWPIAMPGGPRTVVSMSIAATPAATSLGRSSPIGLIDPRTVVLLAALGGTTMLTVVLGITDPNAPLSYPSRFLIWNLFLAWIPLGFAFLFAMVRRRIWLVPLGIAWLAFLPNAPYLVTDLVHLREGYDLWRHVLQYGFAAWTGLMLGVVSMRLIHRRLTVEFGPLLGWASMATTVALCAVGVVIGRFQRWNSWDLIHRPNDVVAATFDWVSNPLSSVQSTGVGIAVAAFLALAYLTMWGYEGIATAPLVRPNPARGSR